MDAFWSAITGAPLWVYLLLVVLVSVGIKATKPRTINIRKLVLVPLVFVAWSLYSLYPKLALGSPVLLLVWAVCIAIGAYLGVREVRKWKIAVDRHKGQITIPGNYSTLVLILLIFGLKFFWGYYYATHTEIPYRIYFWDTLTSALVTGFFVGRAGFFYKQSTINPKR
jgi:hypothetical protein